MSPATILPCHFSISRGHKLSSIQTLPFSEKYPRFCCTFLPLCSFQSSFQLEPQFQQQQQDDDDEDEHVIGDCVVFEEGIFEEDSYPETALKTNKRRPNLRISKSKAKAQDLIPEKWKGVLAEVTMSKKERREISQDMEFGSRIQKKKTPPLNFVCEEEYSAYRKTKMAQLTPVVLDNPTFPEENKIDVKDMDGLANEPEGKRVSPRNPRRAVYGGSLDDITEFFNSPKYERGRRVSTESADNVATCLQLTKRFRLVGINLIWFLPPLENGSRCIHLRHLGNFPFFVHC